MKRTWVRWALMTAFVVALGFTFVNLGQWQLDRLDQRRDRNATTAEHENAPIQSFEEVFSKPILDSDQWQRVEVRGTFVADQQLQARYRSFDGRTGWELVTPLTTTTGQTVLVNRGFVERPPGQDFPRVFPAPPAGGVHVVGYVRRNEQGNTNQMTPTENTVRLINSDTLAPALGLPLVNGYLSLIEVTPAQSAELEPITPPPPTEGPHWSYAMQWFAFTAIAGVGLVILIRNDIKDRKRAKERAARTAGPTTDTAEEATHGSRTD